MGSNTNQSYPLPHPALSRFRSAPNYVLENFIQGVDSDGSEGSNRFEGSESEILVSRFLSNDSDSSQAFTELESQTPVVVVGGNQMNYQTGFSSRPPHYPRQSSIISSNLARQNSTPAGAFYHLSQSGYGAVVRDEVSAPPNRLSSQLSFPCILPTSVGLLSQPQISQVQEKLPSSNGDQAQFFNPSVFQFPSWNEPYQFPESFPPVGCDPESSRNLFSANQPNQNGDPGNQVQLLSPQVSVRSRRSSSHTAKIKKMLHRKDIVPCRIRAKRGCATHPRSIAERVRRTRISSRIRALQQLVPNMDKQNTTEMLDFAVDYIKDLQREFEALQDRREKCVCPHLKSLQ